MKTSNMTGFIAITTGIAFTLGCVAWPQTSRATMAAATTTDYQLNGSINNTQGWAFTANQPFILEALGVFDFANDFTGPTPDGLRLSKHIRLWTSGGTMLAEATVPSGAAGIVVGSFRYTSIAPIVVVPGDYVIGAAYGSVGNQGDPDPFAVTGTFTTGPAITITDGRVRFSGDGFPDIGRTPERFGPNMLITVVPEPSAGLLLGASLLVLALIRRRRKSPKLDMALPVK